MGFTIRHDTPTMLAAIAAGIGTEQGRALVDRAVYEREQQLLQNLTNRAYQRPADATPVNQGGGYAPTLRDRIQSRDPVAQYLQPATRQQPAGDPYAADRLDLQRQQLAHRADVLAAQQQNHADRMGLDRGRMELAAARQASTQSGAASPPMQAQPQAAPAAPRAGQARTASTVRDAASIIAASMSDAALAKLIGPAFNFEPIDPETGEPSGFDAPYTKSDREQAGAMVKALGSMPSERGPGGEFAYSLRQLAARADGLQRQGVPESAIAPLNQGMTQRVQLASRAVQEVQAAMQRESSNLAIKGRLQTDPNAADAIEAKILQETAEAYGMTPEQLVDDAKWLAEQGFRMQAPQRTRLVERRLPDGRTEVVPQRGP